MKVAQAEQLPDRLGGAGGCRISELLDNRDLPARRERARHFMNQRLILRRVEAVHNIEQQGQIVGAAQRVVYKVARLQRNTIA